MKIKKFTAKTFAEALELVKKELSQDAVILATEEKKGLRPHVEVTAAVDYDGTVEKVRNQEFPAIDERQENKSGLRTTKSEKANASGLNTAVRNAPSHQTNDREELRNEIGSLRSLIESMKNSGYELALPAKKRAILNFLRERSIREEFALRLCDKTTDVADIPLLISSDIRVKRHETSQKAVMIIGPTGVGKTTTIAKLASRAVKAGKKTALISLDTYRIGAVEQIRIYARILGIPLATATTATEFRTSLKKFTDERDIIFIDTTGRNPRDGAYVHDMADICTGDIPLELHLLMSANADDEAMIDAYNTYRSLPINYIGFSKIDEAVRFGALYNLCLTYQKPVAWLTTGQRVPGDLEHATVKRLASLIMTKECPVC